MRRSLALTLAAVLFVPVLGSLPLPRLRSADLPMKTRPEAKAKAATVPLDVTGDTVMIVQSFPFRVTAPDGADVYAWKVPAGLTYADDLNVLVVTAGAKGAYKIGVTSTTVDYEFIEATKTIRKKVTRDKGEITVNVGEIAPPTPPVPPVPPTPPVPPLPAGDVRVLIAYETADLPALAKSNPGQYKQLFDLKFRAALKGKCDAKGPNGYGVMILDKDNPMPDSAPFWKTALARPRASTPFIHIFKGDAVVDEKPLPDTAEATLALVDKYIVAKGKKVIEGGRLSHAVRR